MNHFFDIGSNVGQTFDDFLCKTNDFDGWTIWCFEPSYRHFPELVERAVREGNRFHIKLCNFGVVGNSGLRQLFLKDDPRGDSLFEHLASEDHLTQNLKIGVDLISNCIPIVEFINFIPIVDKIVIKLDCEGSEYDILTSLLSAGLEKRPDRIMVEFHTISPGGGDERKRDSLHAEYRSSGVLLERWMF